MFTKLVSLLSLEPSGGEVEVVVVVVVVVVAAAPFCTL